MNIFQIKQFVAWLWRAKTRYGIHSPFVYNLITQCLNDNKSYPEYQIFKQYRKHLQNNPSIIKTEAYGAGSKYFKSPARKIKDMLRISSASYKEMKLWFRLVRYFKAEKILELGTHLGVSTLALSLATKGKVISIEGDQNLAAFSSALLQDFRVNNVEIIQSDFESFLESNKQQSWDLVLIDGNHAYKPTKRYFELLKNQIHNDSLLIFHDIHLNKEMYRAWQEIIRDSAVKVSIDLFCCGLVFFRKEQFKEDFIIRF